MPHSMKLALIFLMHNKTVNLLKTFSQTPKNWR